MPGWLAAHLFLRVLDGLAVLRGMGVVFGQLGAGNVRVVGVGDAVVGGDGEARWRGRGYPDVRFVGLEDARILEPGEKQGGVDVRGFLGMLEEVVRRRGDGAPSVDVLGDAHSMAGVVRDVRALLASTEVLKMENVERELRPKLEEVRSTGPETVLDELLKLLHEDLVTEKELDDAMRDPVVLRFKTKREELQRVIGNDPVVMGSGGHAGMKTMRIMVLRFTGRRNKFLRAVGEGDVDGEGDVKMEDHEI